MESLGHKGKNVMQLLISCLLLGCQCVFVIFSMPDSLIHMIHFSCTDWLHVCFIWIRVILLAIPNKISLNMGWAQLLVPIGNQYTLMIFTNGPQLLPACACSHWTCKLIRPNLGHAIKEPLDMPQAYPDSWITDETCPAQTSCFDMRCHDWLGIARDI